MLTLRDQNDRLERATKIHSRLWGGLETAERRKSRPSRPRKGGNSRVVVPLWFTIILKQWIGNA